MALSTVASIAMLSVVYADCHIKAPYAECLYAECRYADCRGAARRIPNSGILLGRYTRVGSCLTGKY